MNMTAMMEYTDDSYSQGERNLGSISKDGSHSHSSWGASDDDTDHTSVTETKRKPSSAKSEEMLKIEERSRKETRNLRAWRSILILVMISTGALTSVGTYLYIANQQRQEALDTVSVAYIVGLCKTYKVLSNFLVAFSPAKYSLFTHTVKNASDKQVHDFRLGMMSMAATITSSGFKSTSNFPFISIPMFEVVGSYTRRLTRVDYVSWNPLVADSERAQWVEFVKKEIGWYEESKKVSSSTFTESFVDEEDHHDHQHFADFESNSTFLEDIWRGNRSLTDRKEIVANVGLSAPIWQCSPPPYSSSFLNYDMMSEKIIQDMLPPLQKFRSGLLSVSQDSFAQLPESFSAESDGEAAGDAEVRDLPHSLYVRPVFEGMDDSRSKVVGFLASVVPWDIFMSNLLPDGVKGITAVLKNTCNQSYTFVINGQQVRTNTA